MCWALKAPKPSAHSFSFFGEFCRRPVKYKTTQTDKMPLMKTDQPNQSAAVFLQTVSVALAQLKQRLQREYEQGYPDLRELIRIVLDSEEARARELTFFPHLLLPDMVEAHLGSLNLRPTKTKHGHAFAAEDFNSVQPYESAVSFCG
jgi:hypothetical protein